MFSISKLPPWKVLRDAARFSSCPSAAWTGLTWLIAVSDGLPPICLSFVIFWRCHFSFTFKNSFGKISEISWFTFYLPSCVRTTACLLANPQRLGRLLAVFFRWIHPAGSQKISTRHRRRSVMLLVNGACHKQTWPWKKQLIDRWWDGLMTHVIPLETGWQKDISGKLSSDGRSLQHPLPVSLHLAGGAGDWWQLSVCSLLHLVKPARCNSCLGKSPSPTPGRFDRVEPHRI